MESTLAECGWRLVLNQCSPTQAAGLFRFDKKAYLDATILDKYFHRLRDEQVVLFDKFAQDLKALYAPYWYYTKVTYCYSLDTEPLVTY